MKRWILLLLGFVLVGCSTVVEPPASPPTSTAGQPTAAVDDGPPPSITPTAGEAEPSDQPTAATAETSLDEPPPSRHSELLSQVLFSGTEATDALTQIRESGDTRFVAGLIDALRYRWNMAEDIAFTLNTLTGAGLGDEWQDWVEWAGRHPEIESFADYDAWKADLFAQIDPNFRRFIYPGVPIDPNSRLEEVVWGGVRVDGIPALDNPTMVDPEEADYLVPEERVFGVSINGDTRAYPARFLDWHEMFNDVVGGQPVSLAYCTLCGAAVLYQTSIDESQLPDGYTLTGGQGEQPKPQEYFTFGSSGFLYLSNKLMYDRQTDTLWHQILGTPAFGPLVGSGLTLERLPVTLTTWENWYAQHPDTKVMDFSTGFVRDYSAGAAYAEYFASPDTMFPVWQRSEQLPTKSWVFTQLIENQPKAYPLTALEDESVINDTHAGQNLVVILEDGGLGAAAYDRGDHTFTAASPDSAQRLLDENGLEWHVTDDALVNADGDSLDRLPGHMAYWFGWYSFYPRTEVYGLSEGQGNE